MTSAPIDDLLDILSKLVAVDTANPPRAVTRDGPLMSLLTELLPGFDIKVCDYGDGCLTFEAVRGTSDVLFNVHLDTVPVAQGWTRNPHSLSVEGDKAYGLGACDIKGAAATLVALARNTDHPMRFLFSTDEEAGQSRCIRRTLEAPLTIKQVVVAEPTMMQARLEHRGIFSAKKEFHGRSGHASGGAAESAIHKAVAWMSSALATPAAQVNRLNIGRIEGGVKPNMIAAHAELLFGFRAAPGESAGDVLAAFGVDRRSDDDLTIRFEGPALPASREGEPAEAQRRAADWCANNDISVGDPVNFWTEASLFGEAGYPSCVLGPGDIAQAHTADEWVSIDQLAAAYDIYGRILRDA